MWKRRLWVTETETTGRSLALVPHIETIKKGNYCCGPIVISTHSAIHFQVKFIHSSPQPCTPAPPETLRHSQFRSLQLRSPPSERKASSWGPIQKPSQPAFFRAKEQNSCSHLWSVWYKCLISSISCAPYPKSFLNSTNMGFKMFLKELLGIFISNLVIVT